MNIKVFTTDPSLSPLELRQEKKRESEKLLLDAETFSRVDVEYFDLSKLHAKVKDGRFEERWLKDILPHEYAKGYSDVVFYLTRKQGKDLGLTQYIVRQKPYTYRVILENQNKTTRLERTLLRLLQ